MDIKAIQSFKDKRTYLPKDFKLTDWDSIKGYFNDLESSNDELKVWLKKWSELDAFLDEDMAWRYIKMTCDTSDENLVNAYAEFVEKIMPSLTTISNELNKLLLANPSKEELKAISAYAVMFRGIEKEVEIFREENVALKMEEQLDGNLICFMVWAI